MGQTRCCLRPWCWSGEDGDGDGGSKTQGVDEDNAWPWFWGMGLPLVTFNFFRADQESIEDQHGIQKGNDLS